MGLESSKLDEWSKIDKSLIRVWSWQNLKEWVTHPTLRVCNSLYMQVYFNRFFVLFSSEVVFSFQIKISTPRTTEMETEFFHSLKDPKGRIMDYFFCA